MRGSPIRRPSRQSEPGTIGQSAVRVPALPASEAAAAAAPMQTDTPLAGLTVAAVGPLAKNATAFAELKQYVRQTFLARWVQRRANAHTACPR